MKNKFTTEAKVGFFILATLAGIFFLSLVTSDFGFKWRGYYDLFIQMDSANGITHKTPVQLSGIVVGYVDSINLADNNQALVKAKIQRGVKLRGQVKAAVRSRGVLGDTYVELKAKGQGEFPEGGIVTDVQGAVDMDDVVKDFHEIAMDVKAITQSLKGYTATQDALIPKILQNMEVLTRNIAALTTNNSENINLVLSNLRSITSDLRYMVRSNQYAVDQSLDHIANITRKIDEGQGTVGKLINDDSTVKKLNEVADNLNSTLGGISRMKAKVGWHVEYLGNTSDFKNYVSLNLAPKPDKFFLFEAVSDSDPSATTQIKTTQVTAGGSTTTVTTTEDLVDRDKILFSAQIGKKIRDFTVRGGLIESTGGVGLDYTKGPIDVQFSAFDFRNTSERRPHLKALANVHVTDNLYILGGVDDFISKQHGPDWFVGAGIQFDDEDIKSVLGMLTISK